MSRPSERVTASRVGAAVLGLIFVALTGVLGALLGGAYVRFLMPRAVDGWTGIAEALGGLMTGGLIGIVIALFLAVPLARRGARALAIAAAASAAAAGLLLLTLYLARPQRSDQRIRLLPGNERLSAGKNRLLQAEDGERAGWLPCRRSSAV